MGATLLLADDSITIQKVVELTFAETDHEVVAVGNGRDLLARIDEVKPDIVLCDVVMPDMTGYEICQRLKSDPATLHIPVVLLTGTFEPFDRDRAVAAGCDAIVTKPFEARDLVATIDDLWRQREAVAVAEGGAEINEGVGVPEGVEGLDFTTTGFDQMVAPPPVPELAPEHGLELTGSAFSSDVSAVPPPAPPEFADDGVVEHGEAATADDSEDGWEAEQGPAEAADEAEVAPEPQVEVSEPFGGELQEPAEPTSGLESEEAEERERAARAMAHLEEVERRSRGVAELSDEPPDDAFEFAPADSFGEPPVLAEPAPVLPDEPEPAPPLPPPTVVPAPAFAPVVAQPETPVADEPPVVAVAPEPAGMPGPHEQAMDQPDASKDVAPTPVSSAAAETPPSATLAEPAGDEGRQGGSIGPADLSQDDVDRIARRVLELAEPLLSRIAWEIIPDMAEMLVRQRIRELEEAAEDEG